MTSKSAPAPTRASRRKGSEKLLERTVVEVKGDKLIIHPEQQNGWFHCGWITTARRLSP